MTSGQDTAGSDQAPKCVDCGYVLTGLPDPRCPECGREFDLNDPRSFTTHPPFMRWRYWLPAFGLTLGMGLISYLILIWFVGYGWAVTFVLPFCLGSMLGYGCRVSYFVRVLLGIIIVVSIMIGLFSVSMVGVFCGLVLGGIALGPLIIGTAVGASLRLFLKRSAWDQRWYLPTLVLLISPFLVGAIESILHKPYADESVSTRVTLPISLGRAWNAVMFYEEVHHTPPLLMRFALPRPLYTRGSIAQVGDRKVCVYSKGQLVKVVTQRIVNQRLAFDVVQQTRIENHSVRLEAGSFEFQPRDSNHTSVTLTTRYEPLLGPRWVWRPFEKLGVHTLHGYVLEGMRLKATAQAAADTAGGAMETSP